MATHPVTQPIAAPSQADAGRSDAPVAAFAGVRRVPPPVNDQNRTYAPGSPERADLKARLKAMAAERLDIPLVIGGREIRTGRLAQTVMPHDHHHVLADYHLAGPEHVHQAIAAAADARREWGSWPWEDRAAVLLRAAELDVLFNLAKLFALTVLGFWFLGYFEAVSWAVLIAVVIPIVDALSVWRGPTDYIVSEQPSVFDDVSIAFRVPGENVSANIGPPDILFFSLFLGAAARFGLRVAWTWLAMVALLGLTLALTATTDVSGLPALPAICLGFLLPNADLIWRSLRRR